MKQVEAVAPAPHPKQAAFIDSIAKRKVIRAGRRSGKTVGVSILALVAFFAGRRVLYAAPTQDQIDRFWTEIVRALWDACEAGAFYKNETRHIIEKPGTENRIRAKTAWNADTLRGDYADLLILDEYQLMSENAWGEVGAPMLLDNDGDAVFIYTPPSLQSRSTTKARDPQHAAKLYRMAKADNSGRWAAFHFTSHDNPHISKVALSEITKDMTALAIRQEIEAEDVDEAPGALWERKTIEKYRKTGKVGELEYIVVGVDPTATSAGDEAGIVGAGRAFDHYHVLKDDSQQGSPHSWAQAAINLYKELEADLIIAESNNGGEMVSATIHAIDKDIPVKLINASRGKQTRAQPVSAQYEKGKVHHRGSFEALEDEMCLWVPGDPSPNRMDALVWAISELMNNRGAVAITNPFYEYEYATEDGMTWDGLTR